MAKYTPMMEQYLQIKSEYEQALVLFRLGDFYELFFEDARTASRVLQITLTGREAGQAERVPMCGVPHHALDPYVAKLVDAGFSVAICEQVEEPMQGKGIVRREVVRVVTPGTIVDEKALSDKVNRFVACVVPGTKGAFGLAFCDVSTGEFFLSSRDREMVADDLLRFSPAEVVLISDRENDPIDAIVHDLGYVVTVRNGRSYTRDRSMEVLLEQYQLVTADSIGLHDEPDAIYAAGALLNYLRETQKRSLSHIRLPQLLDDQDILRIDSFSRRNLELVESIREKTRAGTLLWLLDDTRTAMGARTLRRMIERPFRTKRAIERRLDAVEELTRDVLLREETRELLHRCYDLERLIGKVSYGSANARDLCAIRDSLALLPAIQAVLAAAQSEVLVAVRGRIVCEEELVSLIDRAIVPEPPTGLRDGGIIQSGFDARLDQLQMASREGKSWIAQLERKERERTGIRSLKVGFTKVFGYYIEISNSNLALAPDDYIRKQTLANAERYVTPELKEKEALILEAEEKTADLEYELFMKVRDAVAVKLLEIQESAQAIAELDALQSIAHVSVARRYTRPTIAEDDRLVIRAGRHPVVEASRAEPFIANDTDQNGRDRQIALITGPNMAGKSTYMRQVALIVIMAQMGCFVPAVSAVIGVVDRLYTRIGAADDLAAGQSTFMVEMVELSNILSGATAQSLIILDEIGRGTSTFDGISIAEAVIEYLYGAGEGGSRTLFATHYHELTKITERLPGVKNYSTTVREEGASVVFLRKIVPGVIDRSYGIHVAKLAGLPKSVTDRAEQLLLELEQAQTAFPNQSDVFFLGRRDAAAGLDRGEDRGEPTSMEQTSAAQAVIAQLMAVELSTMTPLEAMNVLNTLQSIVRGG